MTALYRCASLQQRFGTSVALDVPALAIEAGGIHLLTGPNGSGKSTLLSVLAFLSPPSQGELWFRGALVRWTGAELRRLRREVTLVHQLPYLFSGTVADNAGIGLRHRGLARPAVAARVSPALEMVGLGALAARQAATLSGGEARRLALARAILLEPSVLLLDEPFANLDAESADVVETILTQLTAAGRTVILSSHEPEHLDGHRGPVIRLCGGRITASEASRPERTAAGRAAGTPRSPAGRAVR